MVKNRILICRRFIEYMKTINPTNFISDVFMFDWASNIQLGGDILKIHYTKSTVMRGAEHTVSLFFNDVSKHPIVN